MTTVISVENLSKSYQLGVIGTGTFRGDLQRWWARSRGLPDPFLKVGEADHGNRQGETLWALRDINFQVQQGEALGIIGRNGAGKSTLLKILSRVTAPTSGEVKVKGRIASLLEVGTGFHPELTGRENILLNAAILGMSRAEVARKFDEIVDFSGVEQFIDTPVKRYSSGMYVRLAFAVAAHLEPDILVVDEVLAVGDAEFQKKCLGKMGDVAGEGRTILFVSHNMVAIKSLCSKSIYLKNGGLISQSNTDDVIALYYSDMEHTALTTPLKERMDRHGDGRARVVDFYVLNEQNERQTSLKPGESYTFVMEYEKNNISDILTNIVGSIGIVNASSPNQFILLYRSNFTNQNFALKGNKGIIKCAVKDFNLAPGIYNIVTFLSNNDTDTLDMVDNVAQILVENGDYFGTGNPGLPSICKVLSRADWMVKSS